MRRPFAILLCAASLLLAGSAEFDRAQRLYNQTNFDESLKVLQGIPAKDHAVQALMGRNYYMLGDYKKATELLEKAFAAEPRNAEYALWLGRSYGRRAETASVFTAPGYASKTRQYFEKSVQLDPHQIESLNDLFEYYLEAPGFLGGGLDKASTVAGRIAVLDAAEGHYALARIAEKRKEYGNAEEHFRRAAEAAPQQAGRLIDLAKFLAKQGRFQESEQNFERAAKIAPNSPKLLFERADTYIHQGRNLETARQLLRQYVQAALTPDDPPRAQAEKLLRQASGG